MNTTQFTENPWNLTGAYKYKNFSMGSQFNGDTFDQELNKGLYERMLKIQRDKVRLHEVLKSTAIDVDFKEIP